jgi:hypothetical protein
MLLREKTSSRGPGQWLTFARWARLTRWLPPSLRCRLHAMLPDCLERQAWNALADEVEEMRAAARVAGMSHLSETVAAELERLREVAGA